MSGVAGRSSSPERIIELGEEDEEGSGEREESRSRRASSFPVTYAWIVSLLSPHS